MKFLDAKRAAVTNFSNPEFIQRIREEDSSMVKNLPILKAINQHGYLTTESQAGRFRKGKSVFDGKHYEISERAYICGFMLEKDAALFIKRMGLYTDKNAIYIPITSDDTYLPPSLDIPLTTTKKAGQQTVDTHMSAARPKRIIELELKQIRLNKSEKAVFVECWDTHWNRLATGKEGLFTDVLRILKSI
jgi:hypothetical protein